MPSTRRPTYRGGSGTGGSGSRPPSAGTGTDVISASKTATDTAADTAVGRSRNPQNPQGTPDNGPGKVLSFPEPKGKRRRRILLSTIGIVAVLMAGIVAKG